MCVRVHRRESSQQLSSNTNGENRTRKAKTKKKYESRRTVGWKWHYRKECHLFIFVFPSRIDLFWGTVDINKKRKQNAKEGRRARQWSTWSLAVVRNKKERGGIYIFFLCTRQTMKYSLNIGLPPPTFIHFRGEYYFFSWTAARRHGIDPNG